MIDLDELERITQAATPGPWEIERGAVYEKGRLKEIEYFICNRSVCDDVAIASEILDPVTQEPSKVNAEFIAAFNPAVAAELIRRLREAERDAEKEDEHGR